MLQTFCARYVRVRPLSLAKLTLALQTELLDAYSENGKESPQSFSIQPAVLTELEIGFHHATFAWSNDSDGSVTPSGRRFALRIEDELKFKKGKINLVIGPTGSGKTSLLMALLGECLRLDTCG